MRTLSKRFVFLHFTTFKVVRLGRVLLTGIIIYILSALSMQAQVMERKTGVDTLSAAERLSVRTNAADWLMLLPNIGVEYDIRNTNWNRWSVGLNLRSNWQSSHTYRPGIVYNLTGIRAEVRNYRRTRQMNYSKLPVLNEKGDTIGLATETNGLDPHTNFIGKIFSVRRKKIKYPLNTYYRGLYLSYNDFSLKFASEGKQGSALGIGMTYGFIRPLHEYPNGNSLDFELGISGGIAYTKYDTYRHNRESDCYSVVESKDWHIIPHPVISEIKVGFVYRFGNYPITKKYRWRVDVDTAYQSRVRDKELKKYADRINKENDRKKSAERKVFVKDSIQKAKIKQHKADSIRRIFEKDSIQKAKIAKQFKDSLRKDSIQKAKIENKRLKQVEEALQDSVKAVKQLEKKRDKAKKKEDEEEKKDGDTAFIIKDESDDWLSTFLITEERRRRYV